ncbi:MAG: metal-sulfur cluster assembly factor [Bifidobacteriaceae bacterium]|jgi:metal-sulfur cluster biosynthetic enzyme|nr:metal-sulfur cluster assembly factor [Bifidobacteriaceae bacterium]MCI1978607.1 metal-sulfur cluster assembly factor [Bifidobacteriaceae bacterium]
MSNSDSLVPGPSYSILDAVMKEVPDEGLARKVISNPSLAGTIGHQGEEESGTKKTSSAPDISKLADAGEPQPGTIAITALNDIGRATAEDIKEAMHQVIDPELGIDVVDLGLVYGIEIDELNRAILTMTLTTPACPLTDLLEDETASVLAGLVEEFRIDWVWTPVWSMDMITPEGREQLNAIGYNF